MMEFFGVVGSAMLFANISSLVVSNELTDRQRQEWRVAMSFPKQCRDGQYEWLDMESMPDIYFTSMSKDETLVYSVCERYAYQDEVNVYLLDKERTTLRLVQFPVVELDEESERYHVEITPLLIERGIDLLPTKQIRVTRHYSGAGNCGTLTTYALNRQDDNVIAATITEFRAQIDCDGMQVDMSNWPRYQISCQDSQQGPNCRVWK